MWKPDVCIYHGGCDDGFGAAWAIWHLWGDSVKFIPGKYGEPFPDITNSDILFVDYSAKKDVLKALASENKSIVVLDHHKTAEEDLAEWKYDGFSKPLLRDIPFLIEGSIQRTGSPIFAWFDMKKSGAMLAWEFAHDTPAPEAIKYIQDRDLWKFELPNTKRFSAALQTYEKKLFVWDSVINNSTKLLIEGESILKAHEMNVQKLVEQSYLYFIDGLEVPVVNSPPAFASDVANALFKVYPDAPFSACWFHGKNGVNWSLRSENHRMDVSEIAKKFGGGGHRNAAGFKKDCY